MSTIDDEAPEGLRAVYEEELPPAAFGIDDVLAGGRRRRRRRQAAQVAGSALTVAALAGIAVAGVRGLEPRVVLIGTPAGRAASTASATTPSPEPGCSVKPSTCTTVLRDWLDQNGMELPRSEQFRKDPSQNGLRWEKGTWHVYSAVQGGQDPLHHVELGVTLSPTTTVPLGNTVSWSGFDSHPVPLPGGETATAYVSRDSGETTMATWLVPARKGVHPAVRVELFAIDKNGTATLPKGFDDVSVAQLLKGLI